MPTISDCLSDNESAGPRPCLERRPFRAPCSGSPGWLAAFWYPRASSRADDHLHDAVVIDAVASQGRDQPAVAQDSDAIRDRKHLIEIVRDQDDRGALGFASPAHAGTAQLFLPRRATPSARPGSAVSRSRSIARAISTSWRSATARSPTREDAVCVRPKRSSRSSAKRRIRAVVHQGNGTDPRFEPAAGRDTYSRPPSWVSTSWKD